MNPVSSSRLRSGLISLSLAVGGMVALGGLVGCNSSSHSDSTPPGITTQPTAVTTLTGDPATFTVVASGANLKFVWRLNGVDIPFSNAATYTLKAASVQDRGSYTVKISNEYGSITSQPVDLVVNRVLEFARPYGMVFDGSGNLFVADAGNHAIQRIDTAGQMTLFAGSPGTPGTLDGAGAQARFNWPAGMVIDATGNLFVADQENHAIRKITAGGVVSIFAGQAGVSGSLDGAAGVARFNGPTGLVMDASGNIIVADTRNHTLRKVSPAGVVTTLAGSAGTSGSNDGAALNARFTFPGGLSFDSNGNLYIGDFGNATLRKLGSGATVSTVSGAAGETGSADGTATTARFLGPQGVLTLATGKILVADTGNHTVRSVASDGSVTTLLGTAGSQGHSDGTGTGVILKQASGLTLSPLGVLYIADTGNGRIRKVDLTTGKATTLVAPN